MPLVQQGGTPMVGRECLALLLIVLRTWAVLVLTLGQLGQRCQEALLETNINSTYNALWI